MNRDQMIAHLTLMGWEPRELMGWEPRELMGWEHREQRTSEDDKKFVGLMSSTQFVFYNYFRERLDKINILESDRRRATRNWSDIDDKILGLFFDFIVKET